MLSAVVVKLVAQETSPLDPAVARHVHGLFLRLLREGDAKIAEECHHGHYVKPFTLSTIYGKFGRTSTARLFIKGFEYWFRVTLLTEETFNSFSKVIFPYAAEQKTIYIGDGSFQITSAELEGVRSRGWSGISSFEDILDQVSAEEMPCDYFAFQFYSPTTFRQGKVNYIMPDPSLVFGSLLKKWNEFSSQPFPKEIKQEAANNLVLTEYSLRSTPFNLGDHELIGFRGRCKYDLLKKDNALSSAFGALNRFSFFAGVGQKTTMGMGMVRPI